VPAPGGLTAVQLVALVQATPVAAFAPDVTVGKAVTSPPGKKVGLGLSGTAVHTVDAAPVTGRANPGDQWSAIGGRFCADDLHHVAGCRTRVRAG
jgi:hypothetical protein